jgi:hypothetical protein
VGVHGRCKCRAADTEAGAAARRRATALTALAAALLPRTPAQPVAPPPQQTLGVPPPAAARTLAHARTCVLLAAARAAVCHARKHPERVCHHRARGALGKLRHKAHLRSPQPSASRTRQQTATNSKGRVSDSRVVHSSQHSRDAAGSDAPESRRRKHRRARFGAPLIRGLSKPHLAGAMGVAC